MFYIILSIVQYVEYCMSLLLL